MCRALCDLLHGCWPAVEAQSGSAAAIRSPRVNANNADRLASGVLEPPHATPRDIGIRCWLSGISAAVAKHHGESARGNPQLTNNLPPWPRGWVANLVFAGEGERIKVDERAGWRQVLRPKCPRCGHQADDRAQRFCTLCGALLDSPEEVGNLWWSLAAVERLVRRQRLVAQIDKGGPVAEAARSMLSDLDCIDGVFDGPAPSAAATAESKPIRVLADAHALADSIATPPEVLVRLATNWGDDVAATVAGNRRAPLDLLERLASLRGADGRPVPLIWEHLAGNPAAPQEVLDRALGMPGPVSASALKNPAVRAMGFLAALDDSCRGGAARAFSVSAAAAAGNPACPSDILEVAAAGRDESVRHAVIANAAAPEELRVLAALGG